MEGRKLKKEIGPQLIAINRCKIQSKYDEIIISEKLITSIEKNGIIEPIYVQEDTGGKFHVVDGVMRFLAARKLGVEEIPAFVLTPNDLETNYRNADNIMAKANVVTNQFRDMLEQIRENEESED